MPLSPSTPRTPLHNRTITCNGYQRSDGLWEVEGHLTDSRAYEFSTSWRGDVAKEVPIHDMWMRIAFDKDMVIRTIEVATDASPYPASCPNALNNYQRLVGEHIGGGFAKRARKHIGGRAGCTHHTELLRVLGSVAMQTMSSHYFRFSNSIANTAEMFGNREERPAILESCHSYATDNEVVGILWPDYYTGPQRKE